MRGRKIEGLISGHIPDPGIVIITHIFSLVKFTLNIGRDVLHKEWYFLPNHVTSHHIRKKI